MRKKALKAAFPHTLPVMAGYIVLGIGFGVLLTAKGFSPWYALLMSVVIFAGSMQYVAVDLLSGGATLIATAIMTLLIHARHLFYGISMLERFKDVGRKRSYLIFGLTDETYSLLCQVEPPEDVDRGWFYFFITALNHGYWIIGGVIGAVAGAVLPFDFRGIEFSMTALFVVILTDQWITSRDHRPAVIGLVCSVISLLLFGATHFILPAMGMILLALTLLRKPLEKEEEVRA